ncbi:MAG: M81 family metallopeptidase [Gammaproteobacteria bacterium]|nr:M81 family metallopeptidase [Gammaproteobacteria bacterium]
MNKKHRVFVASIATETNTFSPLKTELRDFKGSFYAAPGEHPKTPTLCSAVFPVARETANQYGWELIEGTAAWAEPGGVVSNKCWHFLRRQLLDELRAAMPVDIVLLGLHGAMIAQDCLDCEGNLLKRIREVVGDGVVVGATLDPHSHLSFQQTRNADILVAFKEFPHTDFVIAAENLCALAARAVSGEIRPAISVFDCKMIDLLPTNREPMRGFIDRIVNMEGKGGVLSISVIHGFMAGDSPDLGSKIMVITDGNHAEGDALSRQLGLELFGYRGTTAPDLLTAKAAVDRAHSTAAGPVVIADIWDNPGGGVAGDGTALLHHAIQRKLTDIAFGTIWDHDAVRECFSAGVGAKFRLRFGGKMSSAVGEPVDADVVVHNNVRNAKQSFGPSIVPLGDASWIEMNGIHVILNTVRSQVFAPDLFSNFGLDPASMRILVVKSTNHFHDAFAPLASDILYASVDGYYPNDPRTNHYEHLGRDIWPRVEHPHGILSGNE